MKLISYFSFSKVSLLLVFVCLFFASEVSAYAIDPDANSSSGGMLLGNYQQSYENPCSGGQMVQEGCPQNEDEQPVVESVPADVCPSGFRPDGNCIDIRRQPAQQQGDGDSSLRSACRETKKRYPNQYWPNSCDCSQALPSNILEQCKNKVGNALELVEDCENRKKGLENVWDCNCQDVPSMYYGSVDVGGGIQYASQEVVGYLQSCQARAEGKAESTERVAEVNMAACDSENSDVIKCCNTKQEFYGSYFWPSGSECHCGAMGQTLARARLGGNSVLNNTQKKVIACIQEADQKAKGECTLKSRDYIENTTGGCQDVQRSSANYATSVCKDNNSGVLEKFIESAPYPTFDFSQAVENYLSSSSVGARDNCIKESRKNFISAYKLRCLGIIENFQDGKKQTILCDKSATKKNTMCDQYCQGEAEDKYGTSTPSSDEIAGAIYSSGIQGP